MLPNSTVNIEHLIDNCERNELLSLHLATFDVKDIISGIPFLRVRSLSKFWECENPVDFMQHVIDFAISAHAYQGYLTFVLNGTPQGINIYYSQENTKITTGLLNGAFPGIVLDENPTIGLERYINESQRYMGMLSGIPSRKNFKDSSPHSDKTDYYTFERIIRGMQGASWIYIVQAYARPAAELSKEREDVLETITKISPMIRGQVQRSFQETQPGANRATMTSAEIMGGEIINRKAEYAVRSYERQLKRMDSFISTGRWQTAVYFGASDKHSADRLASLLMGVLSGLESRPEPLRVHMCKSTGQGRESFQTYLSSEELALLIKLPREEAPGYEISDYSVFDSEQKPNTQASLDVGQIKWNERVFGKPYKIAINHLAKHGIVAGVTGSGKTTTLLNLLYQLRKNNPPIPFMVIEPTKTEYRSLLGDIDIENKKASGPIPDLQVYTLGSDVISPFRINPFEFDLGDEPGSAPLLNHIDFLKAVFNAAFILYTPMPYVLETALYEVYEDKGWNFSTESNILLSDSEWNLRNRYPIFPTLTDLYHKVEEVTARLGYESKIEQDVTAGLKARIGALRIGAKGLMLDTPRGISFDKLLKNPVVLELENIGNDDEKTFIIGLIFARIYGYRRLQASEGNIPQGLQHLLVIEEAHRLLKNTNTQVDTESSNLRAQATDSFMNMLSEIRFYNQGVLVAEQIPSKITPDVIKNSNLKIVHKLLAQDDRQTLGFSMNMTDPQIKRLATLKPGEVVIFSEGDDHPLLLQVDNFRDNQNLHIPLSKDLASFVDKFTSIASYLPVPDFSQYGLGVSRLGGPDPIILYNTLKYINEFANKAFWAKLILRTIHSPEGLPEVLENLRQNLSSKSSNLKEDNFRENLLLTLVLGLAKALEDRRKEKSWNFSYADKLRISLTKGMIELSKSDNLSNSSEDINRFRNDYLTGMKKESGPFVGCLKCRNKCSYLSEVKRLMNKNIFYNIREILFGSEGKDDNKNKTIVNVLRTNVLQWIGSSTPETNDIAFCSAVNAINAIGLDEYQQVNLSSKVADMLLGNKEHF